MDVIGGEGTILNMTVTEAEVFWGSFSDVELQIEDLKIYNSHILNHSHNSYFMFLDSHIEIRNSSWNDLDIKKLSLFHIVDSDLSFEDVEIRNINGTFVYLSWSSF